MVYFAHTDFYKYALFYLKKKIFKKDKILSEMLHDLITLTNGKLIIPTYNYDFPKTKKFDYKNDKSQVGVFSEYFRKKYNKSRTSTPMFSTCTTIKDLISHSKKKYFDPFGSDSEYDYLAKNKGKIINFGSDFAPSFIMFIERSFYNGAPYRYEKKFTGKTYSNNKFINCTLNFEVRPLSINIEYDLIKIKKKLFQYKILKNKKTKSGFLYEEIDANKFLNFGLKQLKNNPYFFLKKNTFNMLKKQKKNMIKKFLIKEFE